MTAAKPHDHGLDVIRWAARNQNAPATIPGGKSLFARWPVKRKPKAKRKKAKKR
jgi:hypothetical protein